MSAADDAARVMRLVREYGATETGDWPADTSTVDAYVAVDAAVTALAERANPQPCGYDADTMADDVRAVEDAIDAHCVPGHSGCVYLDSEQGPAVLRALLERGWTPPAVTSSSSPFCARCGHSGAHQRPCPAVMPSGPRPPGVYRCGCMAVTS